MSQRSDRDSRAWFLQYQAERLQQAGRNADAHRHLVEAMGLFGADEETALSGSIACDLGTSFRDLETGIPRENLLKGLELCERALRNRERRRDPIRFASTWDSIGTVKRRLAGLVDGPHREATLTEALAAVNKAIEVGERALRQRSHPAWVRWVAGFYVSLGNHHVETCNETAAIAAFLKAMVKIEVGGDPRVDSQYADALFWATQNLAAARIRRGKPGDLADALQLAGRIIRMGEVRYRSRGHMLAAAALVARGGPELGPDVRAHVKLIDHHHLHEGELSRYLELAELAGETEAALQAIHAWIGRSFEEFSQTKADPDGDAVSYRTQTLAYHGACAYHRLGHHLEAFLMLETAAAPRFDEAIRAQSTLPRTPLAAELVRRAELASAKAVRLSELASFPVDTVREALAGTCEQVNAYLGAPNRTEMEKALTVEFLGILKRAAASGEPTSILKAASDGASADVRLAWAAQERVEPRRKAVRELLQGEARPGQLLKIVASNPDAVFVRIELREHLVIAACFIQDGRLEARSQAVPVSNEVTKLIGSLWCDELPDGAEAALQEIDLSQVLPVDGRKRLVILTSRAMSVLPLAAAGPPGKTPLDLFESVVWLPSLAPLRVDAPAHPPRKGTAAFIPPGTSYGSTSFAPLCAGYAVFEQAEAAHSAVLSAAREAETVVFYTHGGHGEDHGLPGIDLADRRLTPEELSWNWLGIERVELWACDSALERATNSRTSGFEGETFGLDGQMLRHGVRTTIAAQRPLHEFVAVVLHAEYRRGMVAGLMPDAALAGAMRHWRDVDFPELRTILAAPETIDGPLHKFLARRGLAVDRATDGVLGPVGETSPDGDRDARTRAAIEEFGSPFEWATLRFQGIPGRRPTDDATPITETWVPQSDDVIREADRILAELRGETNRPHDSIQIENRIQELIAAVDQDTGATEAVIELAEALRVREVGSTTDNLLMGLAWLHESLATAPDGPGRVDLLAKAATLWLHFAVTLGVTWPLARILSRPRIAIDNARRALAQIPATRCVGHRAILRLLDSGATTSRAIAAVLRSGSLQPEADDDSLWLLAEALHHIGDEAADEVRELLRVGNTRIPSTAAMEIIPWYSGSRLWFALNRVAVKAGYSSQFPASNFTFLVGRERILAMTDLAEAVGGRDTGPAGAQIQFDAATDGLSESEVRVWGSLRPEWRLRFAATGSPVPVYYDAVAGLVVDGNLRPGASNHHLAGLLGTLHLGADLRLLHLHRLARVAGMMGQAGGDDRFEDIRRNLRLRDAALDTLRDWVTEPLDARKAERLDPFALTPAALADAVKGPEHATAWALAKISGLVELPTVTRGRTAAYRAVRSAWDLSEWLTKTWSLLLDTADEHPEIRVTRFPDYLGDLSLRIDENERWLLGLPRTDAVLHLGIHSDGRWWGCLVNGEHQRIAAATASDSRLATASLIKMLGPEPLDFETRGMSGGRSAEWETLRQRLTPLLTDLLEGPINGGVRRVMVFAPGRLRGLPLIGLATKSGPLAQMLDAVVHLPALKWTSEMSPAAGRRACLFNADADGDTSFGEAVTRTQRHWFPPDVIVVRGTDTSREIVEAPIIESASAALGEIRLYSLGAWFGFKSASSGIELPGSRFLSDHNTWWMLLANMQLVEVWASTSPQIPDFVLERGDRIPGMARSFLAAGAASVLDTAWPVHDLVKALVSEAFGLFRFGRGIPPSIALTKAVAAVAQLLKKWRGAGPHESVAAALGWLDAERAATAKAVGLPAEKIVLFPLPDSLRGLPAAGFVSEVSQASHLAAFRLWGSL
jgi:hypothetical protein